MFNNPPPAAIVPLAAVTTREAVPAWLWVLLVVSITINLIIVVSVILRHRRPQEPNETQRPSLSSKP